MAARPRKPRRPTDFFLDALANCLGTLMAAPLLVLAALFVRVADNPATWRYTGAVAASLFSLTCLVILILDLLDTYRAVRADHPDAPAHVVLLGLR